MAWDIGAGESETIESGTAKYGDPLNLDGELNLSGDANVTATTAQSATGSGETMGTATATPTKFASATPTPVRTVAAGDTLTIAAGDSETVSGVNLEGEINLSGALHIEDTGGQASGIGTATATPESRGVAVGDAGTAGSATATPTKFASALGEGVATGAALATIIVPVVRRERAGLIYDDTEEFDLGTDGAAADD
jgi:hypothetical protein